MSRTAELHLTPAPTQASHPGPAAWAFALINQIDCPVMACGSDASLRFANRAAQHLLNEGRLCQVRDTLLHCPAANPFEFRSAIRDAAVHHRLRLLNVAGVDSPVFAAVMPVWDKTVAEGSALILVGHERDRTNLALELIGIKQGLTPKEAAVLNRLIDGMTPGEIATQQRLELSTVRSHIHAIRSKFGVRSVDEVLLRVCHLPPIATLH